MSRPTRVVHEEDALEWLVENALPEHSAIVTSLPNVDEFSHRNLRRWRGWFVDAAELVLRSLPPAGAAIFFQTDIRHEGTWVDKSFLVQQAAERVSVPLLWHKIALRAPVGTNTNDRPGYAHLLCFSNELRHQKSNAATDVLERLGDMTWSRAIGTEVARFTIGWLREHAGARVIVDPFCGVGTVLAVAGELGLDSIGVERNPGRADRARTLSL